MKYKFILALLLAVLVISGCSKQTIEVDQITPVNNSEKTQEVIVTQPEVEVKVDYDKIRVNESGKVMVLMYHGISDKESEWVRTVENFKKDLKTLYDKGYRTISLNDYINNNICIPAGYSPVVITFDDGLQNQFNYIEKNGKFEIDDNCAVSIMMEFSKSYPGFGNAATFFVYYPVPFRQKDKIKEKFEYLISNGFDIGNHSYTHEMLGKLDAAGIQKQLALNIKSAAAYIPDYSINSLALPYGNRPKDENLRKYLISGEHEDIKYSNRAILLVGSNPAPAPNNIDFKSFAIPRVRASEMKTEGTGIYDWLKYFDSNPSERYISDGDPSTVVVPKDKETVINKDLISDKKLILY